MTSRCDYKCTNKFQDEKYGKNIRVFCPSRKQDGDEYLCTVCDSSKYIPKRKER